MKINKRIFKAINSLLAIFLIISSTGPTLASAPAHEDFFVRIDLNATSDVEQLTNLEVDIHARLYAEDGKLSVLGFANAAEIAQLAQANFQVQVLDAHPQGKDYFLVQLPTPQTQSELRTIGTLLDIVSDQAVVAVSSAEFETFSQMGLSSKYISPQPLPGFAAARELQIPNVLDPDPAIQSIIDQITPSAVYSLTGGLTGEWPVTIGGSSYTIATRNSGEVSAIENATQFAYEYFDALGLDVSYHNFYMPYYGNRRNVEAVQAGVSKPERVFLITAHIDNMPSGPIAPGADDNGSGSVGVMLAAEILSQYNFDCTLRYVLFSGEEQGLFGSHYYAQDAYNARDNIEAVLNLDMIAYDSDTQPILDLHTRTENTDDLAIANTFVDVVEAYNLDLIPEIHSDNMGSSDHDSFWDYGFPAILAIEDWSDFTPYYHSVNDNLASLNLDYFTEFVRAAVGTFAHMGCLIPPDGTVEGTVTEAASSNPIENALIEALQNEQVIGSTQSGGDGTYDLSLPAGTYTLRASQTGYAPQYFTEIEIISDQLTPLHFALDFCEPITSADFTFSPPNAEIGEIFYFTSTVSGGSPPILISWDFDDGTTGEGETIQHTFVASDTYQVEMAASNCGPPITVTHPIDVTGYPAIEVSHDLLDFQLHPGEVNTTLLLIRNIGGDTLHWNIAENPTAGWLALSNSSGETPPAISTGIVLSITAPAETGIYTTTLQITSDDTETPLIEVPISLTVSPFWDGTYRLFLPMTVKRNP